MARLRFTPLAEADLNSILDYIAETAPFTARNFVRMIREKCELIATQPEMGRRRSEFPGNYRSFAIGQFVVFYRVHPEEVQIHRVLRDSRDVLALLE